MKKVYVSPDLISASFETEDIIAVSVLSIAVRGDASDGQKPLKSSSVNGDGATSKKLW